MRSSAAFSNTYRENHTPCAGSPVRGLPSGHAAPASCSHEPLATPSKPAFAPSVGVPRRCGVFRRCFFRVWYHHAGACPCSQSHRRPPPSFGYASRLVFPPQFSLPPRSMRSLACARECSADRAADSYAARAHNASCCTNAHPSRVPAICRHTATSREKQVQKA